MIYHVRTVVPVPIVLIQRDKRIQVGRTPMTEEYTKDDARIELQRHYIFRDTDVIWKVTVFDEDMIALESVEADSHIDLDIWEFQQLRGAGILLPA